MGFYVFLMGIVLFRFGWLLRGRTRSPEWLLVADHALGAGGLIVGATAIILLLGFL